MSELLEAVRAMAAKDIDGESIVRKIDIACGPVEIFDATEKDAFDDPGKQYIAVSGKLFATKDPAIWQAVNGALHDKPCAPDAYAMLFMIITRKITGERLERDPVPVWEEPGKRLRFQTVNKRSREVTEYHVAIAKDGSVNVTSAPKP